jgi:hypothetical protein
MSKKSATSENRMVLQLFTYWKRISKERLFPSLVDVDPNGIADIWPHCFILDVTTEVDRPVFHYIGKSLERDRQIDLALAEIEKTELDEPKRTPPTRLGQAAKNFRQTILKKSPVSSGGVFEHPNGKTILFRSILLPLSDNDRTFNYVLGAVSSREISKDIRSSFEVQIGTPNGQWQMDLVADDRDEALFVARRRYSNSREPAVRVVEEIRDPATHLSKSKIIFEKHRRSAQEAETDL